MGKYATENVFASGGIEPPERLYVTLYPQLVATKSDTAVIAAIVSSENNFFITIVLCRQYLTPSFGDIVYAPI